MIMLLTETELDYIRRVYGGAGKCRNERCQSGWMRGGPRDYEPVACGACNPQKLSATTACMRLLLHAASMDRLIRDQDQFDGKRSAVLALQYKDGLVKLKELLNATE